MAEFLMSVNSRAYFVPCIIHERKDGQVKITYIANGESVTEWVGRDRISYGSNYPEYDGGDW
jgi:hypothetical protein